MSDSRQQLQPQVGASSQSAFDEASVSRWRAPEMASASMGPLTVDRLAAIEEQARLEGYQVGLEEGRSAGKIEVHDRARRLEKLLSALQPHVSVLDDQLISQLGDLVMVIARQLVRRELHHESGEIVRVVREALAALPVSDAKVQVYLHPDDLALVKAALNFPDGANPVSFVEDFALSRGGARVETDVSVIDASVERRLNSIAVRLFGEERSLPPGTEEIDKHE